MRHRLSFAAVFLVLAMGCSETTPPPSGAASHNQPAAVPSKPGAFTRQQGLNAALDEGVTKGAYLDAVTVR